MITQTQKDDSSCFDDVSSKPFNSSTLPDHIAHSGLSVVALDVKTANSIEYVRIHSVRSHSVAVVTQAHHARRTTSSLPTSTFPRPPLIAAVDFTNSNDSSCSVPVVLYETREANEIGLHCLYTSLVFSEACKTPNPVFR